MSSSIVNRLAPEVGLASTLGGVHNVRPAVGLSVRVFEKDVGAATVDVSATQRFQGRTGAGTERFYSTNLRQDVTIDGSYGMISSDTGLQLSATRKGLPVSINVSGALRLAHTTTRQVQQNARDTANDYYSRTQRSKTIDNEWGVALGAGASFALPNGFRLSASVDVVQTKGGTHTEQRTTDTASGRDVGGEWVTSSDHDVSQYKGAAYERTTLEPRLMLSKRF